MTTGFSKYQIKVKLIFDFFALAKRIIKKKRAEFDEKAETTLGIKNQTEFGYIETLVCRILVTVFVTLEIELLSKVPKSRCMHNYIFGFVLCI
jgi:hypothetical protein